MFAYVHVHVFVCVCVRVLACVGAYVVACVWLHVCVRAWIRVCACIVRVYLSIHLSQSRLRVSKCVHINYSLPVCLSQFI